MASHHPLSRRPVRKHLRLLALLILTGAAGYAMQAVANVSVGDSATIVSPTPTSADPRFEQFRGECTQYGLAFRDPGNDSNKRIKVFGSPDNPAELTVVDFFGYEVQVNLKVAPCLEAVERDLTAQGTMYEVQEVGGYREERSDRPYWFHQYGGAIDINPSANPQCTSDLGGEYESVEQPDRCSLDRSYDIPDEWINTFERYGFYWGGNFDTGKDFMHFEWHGEANTES